MVFDVRPGPVPGQVSSTPEADPIPQLGRLLWLDTKNADSWQDSNSGASAEALDTDYMPSLSDGVYTFDGSNDQLVMDSNEYNTIAFGHIFIVCRTNDITQRQSLVVKRSLTNSNFPGFDYRIGIRESNPGTDGKIDITVYDTSSGTTLTATNPAPDSEYFLAEFLLESDGTLTYRQNGVDNGSTSATPIDVDSKDGNPLLIGNVPDRTTRQWDGEIAHLSIYARPLTAAERNQVYTHCETWVPSITRA